MKPDLNKIIEQFNNLNDQARYAILGAVVVLIILVDAFFLAMPQVGSIAAINAQTKKISEDTQEVLSGRQRIDQLKGNLQKARDHLSSLSMRVRSIQEVPLVLTTISSVANQYGVKIDQLVPEKSDQENLISAPDGKYYALPILIKARCGYHMFGHFFNKLENGDMYFTVKDFIIQNDDKDPHERLFSLTINVILIDRSARS